MSVIPVNLDGETLLVVKNAKIKAKDKQPKGHIDIRYGPRPRFAKLTRALELNIASQFNHVTVHSSYYRHPVTTLRGMWFESCIPMSMALFLSCFIRKTNGFKCFIVPAAGSLLAAGIMPQYSIAFEVYLNNELIFSKLEKERLPTVVEIEELIYKKLNVISE